MNFHILTLFPDMVMQGLSTSIIGRAKDRGLLSIEAVNIRDYTLERHKKWTIIHTEAVQVCSCRHSRYMMRGSLLWIVLDTSQGRFI